MRATLRPAPHVVVRLTHMSRGYGDGKALQKAPLLLRLQRRIDTANDIAKLKKKYASGAVSRCQHHRSVGDGREARIVR
jgi:hypothetical protein